MSESSVSLSDHRSVASALSQDVGVITDIEGTALSAEDRDFLKQPEIAGLIFFARNYESPEQLKALTAEIKALRPDLLLTVDQEGGRVQRFRAGFTLFEPMIRYEAIFAESPEKALELARLGGFLLASELIAHGVDLTFAPVLDIERDLSQVIGDRAFGHTVDVVTALARAWSEGLATVGMTAVGKHFPGHGAVEADSHLELPVDPRPSEALEADIAPFKTLISEDVIQGIMPAHVVYPAVDADNTAGFSPTWLQSILRGQLGFKGIIFSDDLSMEGAASGGDFYQRSIAAAQAGANALVVCNNREAAKDVVSAVSDLYRAGAGTLTLESLKPDRNGVVLGEDDISEARSLLGSYQLIRDDNP